MGSDAMQRPMSPPMDLDPRLSTNARVVPIAFVLVLAGATLSLASSVASAAAPTEIKVTVTMGDYWFSPNYIAVEVNTTLNITVVNAASQVHEYEILGYGVETAAAPGENGSLVFVANQTGLFTIICGISGHSTLGMVGRLVVIGAGFELNPVPQVASQLIGLLEAVEREYEGANVTGGVIENIGEYNESRDFAETAENLWSTIEVDAAASDDSGAAKVDHAFAELRAAIANKSAFEAVEHEVDELIHELREIGGSSPGTPAGTWQEHLAALRSGLAQVVSLYKSGDAEGADLLLGEVYLDHLEPLEDPVTAVDPALKAQMEAQVIVELRGLLRSGASSATVDAKAAEISATLLQVEGKLTPAGPSPGPWLLLGMLLGLTLGVIIGVVAFAAYARKLRAGASAPKAPTKGGDGAKPADETGDKE
jgi:plastocyanin